MGSEKLPVQSKLSNNGIVMPYPKHVKVMSEVREATEWNGVWVLYFIISLAHHVGVCVKRKHHRL